MVYIKTYIFTYLYKQYLVLLTMVPRNSTPVRSNTSLGETTQRLVGDQLKTNEYKEVWVEPPTGAGCLIQSNTCIE